MRSAGRERSKERREGSAQARREREREKENSREGTKMCVFLFVWSVGWFFMLSGLLKSLSREMIGHFRKKNYPKY